ncbi:MAG: hypothetical protein ACRD1Y_06800, partial [Terriglobales bacterium]
MQTSYSRKLLIFAVLALGLGVAAQAPRQVSAAAYAHAESYLGFHVDPLVTGEMNGAHWLPDGRFWYSSSEAQGPNYVLVNPARATREPAFNREALAQALSAASGERFTVRNLNVTGLTFSPDGRYVTLT